MVVVLIVGLARRSTPISSCQRLVRSPDFTTRTTGGGGYYTLKELVSMVVHLHGTAQKFLQAQAVRTFNLT